MAGTLRITKIRFRAGTGPAKPPLEIQPGTVLVLVGPNNAGKSLALREIESWCLGQDVVPLVVGSMEVDFPDRPEAAEELLQQFKTSPPSNQAETIGYFWIGQHTFRQDQPMQHLQIHVDSLRTAVERKDLSVLRQSVTAPYTVRLDGRTRFSLADQRPTGDLQQHPQNHLWALFKDDDARERVRKLTEDAFGLHFVIDPTGMQVFRIRMSDRPPSRKREEQGLDEAARRFHAGARLISELSDGVQAFVGLVSAVLSLPHKIILIDEPDAFLHPPLARRLGANLARIAAERNASLAVATHSSEFLIGCLEAVGDASVVRLTHESGNATARSLSSSELATMTRDPLLRSTNVLRALFHRAATVTESDTDRAFYDEINGRLLLADRGVKDTLFLNAQNKQTIHRLVGALRHIGIPAAAIVDLDLLSEGGGGWKVLLNSCQIPAARRAKLGSERAYLSSAFSSVATGEDPSPMKSRGLEALDPGDRERAESLLEELSAYGLFLVPVGELESWLHDLGATGHASAWLVDVFSRIGQSETDAHYLRPGDGDVWQFLDDIARWVNDPNRLGTE